MRICILETDRPEGALLAGYGTYADLFETWLGPELPEAEFVHCHIAGGETPAAPGEYDAYMVTGSRAGVYEDHPWIAPLIAHLQAIRDARRPVVGICFGHQVLAQAFGGQARRAQDGWVLGRLTQQLNAAGEEIFGPGPVTALSLHRDQVMELPPAARRLTEDSLSPNGALLYQGFPALSLQFHPEFSPAYLGSLIDSFSGTILPETQAETAKATLEGPVDNDRVARGVARFLRGALASAT